MDPSQYGTVVDMVTFSMGGEEVICYATSMGQMCGLDLRANRNAWQLSNPAKFGERRLCREKVRLKHDQSFLISLVQNAAQQSVHNIDLQALTSH